MTDTFLSAQWKNLIMASYDVNPVVLKRCLPNSLDRYFYKNKSYVNFVGFVFKQTRLFPIPMPFLGTFEEINLRLNVKRVEEGKEKRGVVFIKETIPTKSVTWLANKLKKEHHMAIPSKNRIEIDESIKKCMNGK